MIPCAHVRLPLLLILLCMVLPAADRIAQIDFIGLSRFQPEQLRSALRHHAPVVFADDQHFPGEVAEALRAGFLYAGHPEPSVSLAAAAPPATGWIATVEAGRHFTCGGVRVTADGALDTATLAHDLATAKDFAAFGWDEPGDPLWQAGEPASFHPNTLERLRRNVDRWLRHHGHLDVEIAITGRPRSDGSVDLLVRLTEVGAPQVLTRLRVLGAERSDPAVIRAQAGLQVGEALTGHALVAAQERLFATGSFRAVAVRFVEDSPSQAVIEVEEDRRLPPIQVAPTATEQLLMAAAEHLVQQATSERLGITAQLEITDSFTIDVLADFGTGYHVGLHDDSGSIVQFQLHQQGAWLQTGNQRWSHTWQSGSGGIVVNMLLTVGEPTEQPRSLSGSVTYQGGEDQPPLALDLAIHPGFVRIEDTASEWQLIESTEGKTRVQAGEYEFIFENERLVSFFAADEKVSLSGDLQRGPLLLPQPGPAEKTHLLPTLMATGSALRNIFSLQIAQQDADRMQGVAALASLLAELPWSADFLTTDTSTHDFSIPLPESTAPAEGMQIMIQTVMLIIADGAGRVTDRDHWLRTLPIAVAAAMAGRNDVVNRVVQQLHADPRCGPIGSTVTARLMDLAGTPAAQAFHVRARELAELPHLQAELQPILKHLEPSWMAIWPELAGHPAWADLPLLIAEERRADGRAALEAWLASADPPPLAGLVELLWQHGGAQHIRSLVRREAPAEAPPTQPDF